MTRVDQGILYILTDSVLVFLSSPLFFFFFISNYIHVISNLLFRKIIIFKLYIKIPVLNLLNYHILLFVIHYSISDYTFTRLHTFDTAWVFSTCAQRGRAQQWAWRNTLEKRPNKIPPLFSGDGSTLRHHLLDLKRRKETGTRETVDARR